MEDFGVKGRSSGGFRCLILKGEELISGVESRIRMNSPPHLETREIEVRPRSGERLL